MKTRPSTTSEEFVAAAHLSANSLEFYGRIMMLVRQQRSVINGRYHSKRFHAGGLYIREVIRTPQIHLRPLDKPRDQDNYQLQVEEGDSIRGNLIFSKRRIPADSELNYYAMDDRILAYLPVLRKLTVLDELADA